MNSTDSLTAGWYGKIPFLGDFVSRRLPTSFIDSWDLWLQEAMTVSRSQLGEDWLSTYLTSPIWRFMLMPGICGNSMWAGILMPSVDKVGRHFPLTIALQVEPQPKVMLGILSAQAWYASLEQVALSSLDFNSSPEDLDRNLAQHPFPKSYSGYPSIFNQELASWWQKESWIDHKTLSLPAEDSLTELFEAATEDIFITAGSGKSIWWKVHFETGATQLHCFTGLPSENYFATLLRNTAQ